MPTLSIAEPLQINSIVWIESVPTSEQVFSDRMVKDIESQRSSEGLPVIRHKVADRQQLFDVLDDLAAQAADGLRPILHFDTHGNDSDGLALEPSDEWASWPELLDYLRRINVATENNLVVIFALCCGLHLYKFITLTEAVPAYLFAASEHPFKIKFLLDEVPSFYKAVETEGAFLSPFEATLGKEMSLMNCQGLFVKALAQYLRQYAKGETLERRVDETVQKILERDGITSPTPEYLEKVASAVRHRFTSPDELIQHYAPKFLIGRQPAFTSAELKLLAGDESSNL